MKMLFKKIIAFALILMLVSGTLTSCFAGIGDGGVMGNQITMDSSEPDNTEDRVYIDGIPKSLPHCEIKSYGLQKEVNITFHNTDIWRTACYQGRADFSEDGDTKKGDGGYYVINYRDSDDTINSSLCVFENDVVVVIKEGTALLALSTKVAGYREGIFAEIEKYLENY